MIAASNSNGRPIRFFALVMAGWTVMRLFSQPGAEPPMSEPAEWARLAEMPVTRPATAGDPIVQRWTKTPAIVRQSVRPGTAMAYRGAVNADMNMPVDLLEFITFSVAFANRHFASDPHYHRGGPDSGGLSPQPAPLLLRPSQPKPDRWYGSAWMLWRDNGAAATNVASLGRLGGSQAGLRFDYDLTPASKGRMTAYVRTTAALNRPYAPEAAIGLAYQPARAIPVSLAIERRIALGAGARDAHAILAVGGLGPDDIGQGVVAEGYGQAGIVGFNRRDAFIDGKLSLSKPIPGVPLRIGASLSGGAQPGVERIDIGPEMQIRIAPGGTAARVNVEWRERIAGDAAPASGLAITLAADF